MAIEKLDDLVNELKADGISRPMIDEILEALRVVYIGQEKSGTIGIPKIDVEDLYKTKLDILLEKGVVYTVPHAGIWDYGYRCTEVGTAIGSELMKQYIKEHEKELTKLLEKYPKKLLTWWVETYFNETDTGHLSSHVSQLSFKYIAKELIKALDALEITEGLRKKLVNMGVAVETFDRKETVIAPEFKEFLRKFTISYDEEANTYGAYYTLKNFAERRITTRDELVGEMMKYGYTEENIIEIIKEMSELGLTTGYTDYSKEENQMEEPFRIVDHNGYLAYIEEKYAIPFRESLLKETG